MISAASLPAAIMAGVALIVAAFYLLVWIRARRPRESLAFALTCLISAVYAMLCAGLYSSASPEEGARWQMLQRLCLAIEAPLFVWFLAVYARMQARRPVLLTMVLMTPFLVAWFAAPRLVVSTQPSVKHVALPGGLEITYNESTTGPLAALEDLMAIPVFGFAVLVVVRLYRSGQGGRARPLLVALVAFFACVANDAAIADGLVESVYLIEYAFLAMVVLMGFALSEELFLAARTERALSASERRYRELVEGTEDFVLRADASGRVTLANRSIAAALGLSPEECVGRDVRELIAWRDGDLVEAAAGALVRGEVLAARFDGVLKVEGEERRDVSWTVSAVRDEEGAVVGLAGIGRDVSALRRGEEETFARYQRLERQQEALLGLAKEPIAAAGQFDAAARRVVEVAAATLAVERVGLWLVESDGQGLRCLDVFERNGRGHHCDETLALADLGLRELLESERALVVTDAISDSRLQSPRLREHGIGALLEAPVRVGGQLAGCVRCEHVGGPREWSADEIVFVGAVADQLSHLMLAAQRLSAEESLRASEARYRSMLESMDDLVSICSADGYVRYANPALVRRLGRDPTGEPASEALGDLPSVHAGCREQEKHSFEVEDASTGRTYHVSHVPLAGPNGSISNMAILRDITDVRASEAERRLLSAAIEQAAEIVLVTDAKGVTRYVNPAFERITGFSRDEALGRTPRILESGIHEPAFFGRFWDTLHAGQTWSGRFHNRRKDGTAFVEDAVVSPVRDDRGNLVSYVAVGRDVTDQMRLEEQLRQAQKMEAIGQLAGGVAHDFNNLLTPILGYTELLLPRFSPEDPTHAALLDIRRAADGARRLTRQLLAFGRKQVFEVTTLPVGPLVSRLARMLRRAIREDIDIRVDLPSTVGSIRADASQIDQVLMNLAVNAQDAMPQGGTMSVSACDVDLGRDDVRGNAVLLPGPYVAMAVTDTGSGIDPETLPHVFEPFFTTKAVGKGTGLGLAMAYGIIRQHGGDVWVESEQGHGATFTVLLPRVTASPETQRLASPRSVGGRGSETILVVEDNAMVRALACRALRAFGYDVVDAHDGGAALDVAAARADALHLLLTDVVMPGMNGRELYERLAGTRPDLKVLYMSGYADDVVAHHGALDEGVDFLQKPFTLDALSQKVREILDRSPG